MNRYSQSVVFVCSLVGAASLAQPAVGQMRDVEIKTTKVSGNVYMLEGRGGNIGVSIGDDGVFMIDDQFAPLTGKIVQAIGELTEEPVRFLVNTHWHGDHTGGNENFASTGAIIVAHENVRRRLSTDQFIEAFGSASPASPEGAWPVVTFADSVNFHWNGDDIHVFHVDPAHTDGDSIVQFSNANVLHMGDTYFNSMYPFIDVSSGGSIDGMIAAADVALARTNDATKIIPGHGPLSGVKELREYRDMLAEVSARIHKLADDGQSRDEVIAAKPTADFDDKWGGGFMKPDRWVGIVYDGIAVGAKSP